MLTADVSNDPRDNLHTTAVSDLQLVSSQDVTPARVAVEVSPPAPNPDPLISVSPASPDGLFDLTSPELCGVSYEHRTEALDVLSAAVTANPTVLPPPDPVLTRSVESEIHRVSSLVVWPKSKDCE